MKLAALLLMSILISCSGDPGFVGDWYNVRCSDCYLEITKEGSTFFVEDITVGRHTYRAELKDGILVFDTLLGSSYIKLENQDTLEYDGDIYKKR